MTDPDPSPASPISPAAVAKAPPPFPAPKWEIFSWCMFDFANSSFTTVIVTVIFSVYFTKLVCLGAPNADFLWSVGNAISQGIVLMTAPILGAVADFSGAKKKFLTASWLGCCLLTMGLWFAVPGEIALALALFVLANIMYSAGENLTASFLPELARPEDMGKISGFGWAWGYIGGLASLGLCYPLLSTGGFEIANLANLRLTTVVTGVFFLLAGLPTILLLRERAVPQSLPPGENYFTVGFHRVVRTLREIRRFRELAKFLVVFLFYNCGVVIVVYFAAIFAERTLHFGPKELLPFFLLVQITSAIGAFIFGFVQDWFGARRTIQITLLLWLGVTGGCYFVETPWVFYIVGNFAGLAIGASQSAARALVGVFSPPSRSAEFFGFWGLFWKLSSAIGPLAFGAVSWAAQEGGAPEPQRVAILVTGLFFLLGIIGMLFVNEKAGRAAAEEFERAQATGG